MLQSTKFGWNNSVATSLYWQPSPSVLIRDNAAVMRRNISMQSRVARPAYWYHSSRGPRCWSNIDTLVIIIVNPCRVYQNVHRWSQSFWSQTKRLKTKSREQNRSWRLQVDQMKRELKLTTMYSISIMLNLSGWIACFILVWKSRGLYQRSHWEWKER